MLDALGLLSPHNCILAVTHLNPYELSPEHHSRSNSEWYLFLWVLRLAI